VLKAIVAAAKAHIPQPVKEAAISARRLPRLWTSGLRALPDYLVFGAMRSGTSSLYYNLACHPQVLPALRKQVQFFDVNFRRGLGWYRSNFPTRRAMNRRGRESMITGEASPEYIFHPLAPERIAAALPEVRLIALLRNPVDRAWSHYHHSVAHGREDLSFEDALAAEPQRVAGEIERVVAGEVVECRAIHRHGYLTQGEYAGHLERWLAAFPRARLLILRSEDLFAEPERSMAEVIEFLGLSATPTTWTRFNSGRQDEMPVDMRARLAEHFHPHNRRLSELLCREMSWDN
jgi:hypothetical protein